MNTAEEHQVEDAVFDLRHGYDREALSILLHLLETSHLTHALLVPMKPEVQR